MNERVERPDVWCCRWLWCGVVCGAGWEGGALPMWCAACQKEYDEAQAARSEKGQAA